VAVQVKPEEREDVKFEDELNDIEDEYENTDSTLAQVG
jgi:hypothetical protein